MSSAALILILVLCGAAQAQPQGLGIKTIEYPDETVGTVAGIVVRSGTDEPLRGVQVQVRRPKGDAVLASTVSDNKGRFRFRLGPGQYRLRFFLLGYDIVQIQVRNTGKKKPELRLDLPMGT